MKSFFQSLYLPNRFFALFLGVVGLFAFSFGFFWLYPIAVTVFAMAVAAVVVDGVNLFYSDAIVSAERTIPKVLSLSDENIIEVRVQNDFDIPLQVTIIEELPFQLQVRDYKKKLTISAQSVENFKYIIRPVERGNYEFGYTNVFIETKWKLLRRRFQQGRVQSVAVYPSIIQMKKLSLMAHNSISNQAGIKKIRRIGHSYEFEQIKNYVRGDDYRSINWKATSRRNELMVNQFEDEKAQQIYCVIDKSRVMRMPFDRLSLMDYAINTSLAMSNIALQKHDKAGLITFSDKVGTALKAERRGKQLNKIIHALYNEEARPVEANYQLLYQVARRLIVGRSLILLFTNFETKSALERMLPILRRINAFHLLVVVFFENTEVETLARQSAQTIEGIYTQTVAREFLAEKEAMVQTLRQYGIQAILSRPEDLSVNTLNKYLELKSRGLI